MNYTCLSCIHDSHWVMSISSIISYDAKISSSTIVMEGVSQKVGILALREMRHETVGITLRTKDNERKLQRQSNWAWPSFEDFQVLSLPTLRFLRLCNLGLFHTWMPPPLDRDPTLNRKWWTVATVLCSTSWFMTSAFCLWFPLKSASTDRLLYSALQDTTHLHSSERSSLAMLHPLWALFLSFRDVSQV